VALELVQQRDPFCLDSRAMSYRRGLRSRQRVLEKEGIDCSRKPIGGTLDDAEIEAGAGDGVQYPGYQKPSKSDRTDLGRRPQPGQG
jgi:hypothetical protein